MTYAIAYFLMSASNIWMRHLASWALINPEPYAVGTVYWDWFPAGDTINRFVFSVLGCFVGPCLVIAVVRSINLAYQLRYLFQGGGIIVGCEFQKANPTISAKSKKFIIMLTVVDQHPIIPQTDGLFIVWYHASPLCQLTQPAVTSATGWAVFPLASIRTSMAFCISSNILSIELGFCVPLLPKPRNRLMLDWS